MCTPLKYLLLLLLSCAPAVAQPAAQPAAQPKGQPHAHDLAPQPKGQPKGAESNVDFFWRKSDEAFHAGDYERAVMWHHAIVALDPGDIQSWSVASWLLWSMGRGADATAWVDKGLRANPGSWEMWNEAGEQFELQKLDARSLEAYQHALQILPADADRQDAQLLRRRLAHSAERNKDLSLAARTWRDLVRDYPDEAVNKNNLARVQAQAQAEPQAEPQVLGAKQKPPELPNGAEQSGAEQ